MIFGAHSKRRVVKRRRRRPPAERHVRGYPSAAIAIADSRPSVARQKQKRETRKTGKPHTRRKDEKNNETSRKKETGTLEKLPQLLPKHSDAPPMANKSGSLSRRSQMTGTRAVGAASAKEGRRRRRRPRLCRTMAKRTQRRPAQKLDTALAARPSVAGDTRRRRQKWRTSVAFRLFACFLFCQCSLSVRFAYRSPFCCRCLCRPARSSAIDHSNFARQCDAQFNSFASSSARHPIGARKPLKAPIRTDHSYRLAGNVTGLRNATAILCRKRAELRAARRDKKANKKKTKKQTTLSCGNKIVARQSRQPPPGIDSVNGWLLYFAQSRGSGASH